jgi:hypothetical protein
LKERTKGNFVIFPEGSETSIHQQDYFSFAFSSPPYFDFEQYSNDDGQSVLRFRTLETWLEGYWRQTMLNCYKALTSDGVFGVCFSMKVAKEQIAYTFEEANKMGFYYSGGYRIPFKQVFSEKVSHEIVLIFSKQPPIFEPISVKDLYKHDMGDSEKTFFDEKRIVPKVFYKDKIPAAVEKFKELNMGLSRDLYKGTNLIGVPTHALEYHFGSWNAFIEACGMTPTYVAKSPQDRVKEYFEACRGHQKALSFVEYEQKTGHPATRLKRLFNAGRPYSHLKEELFSVALYPEKWDEFLKKFI